MRDGRKISVIFDIFDTLIKPRIPVHQQYLIVFERYGLKMSESEVKNNFKKGQRCVYISTMYDDINRSMIEFKNLSERYPNYGKASYLTPNDWWSLFIRNVIRDEYKVKGIVYNDLNVIQRINYIILRK